MARIMKHNNSAIVARIFEGDEIALSLATFEYGYQADIFAKALSRDNKDATIIVHTKGRNYVDNAWQAGKRVARGHWSERLTIETE